MAEAAPADKAPEGKTAARPSAIYTTYLHQPDEIADALRMLRNQRTALQLTFENDTTIFSARILDVLDNELLLENLVPRSALKLMSARRRFAFSGRANGLYIYSEDNRVRQIDEDRGVPYFRVPLPARALYQQRRRAARYHMPLRTDAMPATVTLSRNVTADKDHADQLPGRMLDISAGGCRIEIEGPVHPPLATDEVLRGCSIEIPNRFDLNAEAQIRHATYNKLTRKVICGLEFTAMHITDRRRLEQFIQSLSRLTEQP